MRTVLHNNPPLLELLAYDPVLRNVKLIAEAWDAGGLYQVGSFLPAADGLNGMAVTVTASVPS